MLERQPNGSHPPFTIGESAMTDERIGALHCELNAPRFNGLRHFRRNHALYRIAAPMNCLVGCVLSHNVEMIPVLMQRCRSEIAAVEAIQPPMNRQRLERSISI